MLRSVELIQILRSMNYVIRILVAVLTMSMSSTSTPADDFIMTLQHPYFYQVRKVQYQPTDDIYVHIDEHTFNC